MSPNEEATVAYLENDRIAGEVKIGDKIVDLKEDHKLFSCMLLVSKSRPDINLQETVSKYELSVV